jgi:hypothetical protein
MTNRGLVKKKIYMFALVILAFSTGAFARNLQNNIMVGLHGSGGVSWPGGSTPNGALYEV